MKRRGPRNFLEKRGTGPSLEAYGNLMGETNRADGTSAREKREAMVASRKRGKKKAKQWTGAREILFRGIKTVGGKRDK